MRCRGCNKPLVGLHRVLWGQPLCGPSPRGKGPPGGLAMYPIWFLKLFLIWAAVLLIAMAIALAATWLEEHW